MEKFVKSSLAEEMFAFDGENPVSGVYFWRCYFPIFFFYFLYSTPLMLLINMVTLGGIMYQLLDFFSRENFFCLYLKVTCLVHVCRSIVSPNKSLLYRHSVLNSPHWFYVFLSTFSGGKVEGTFSTFLIVNLKLGAHLHKTQKKMYDKIP